MKKILLALIIFTLLSEINQGFAQNLLGGQVRGDFQLDAQYYNKDKELGINDSTLNGKKFGSNAYLNVTYELGNFTAGVRYEHYLNPLNGFDNQYEGNGFAYRFLSYKKDNLEVTAGNFYEQFGNGIILRSYQEWNLGFDNSIDGIRVKYRPYKGVTFKGIVGSQRYFWQKYDSDNRGYLRGADLEFSVNEMFSKLENCKTQVIIGGSWVSKYQKDDPTSNYKLPENVSAFAGRMNINHGNFGFTAEYANKINDPTEANSYIFKNGQALLVSANYTKKGLGITLSAKRIDNMSFKTNRTIEDIPLDINFISPLTRQHGYTLLGLYPYSTQANGEMGGEAQLTYFIKKNTWLGGKYGTELSLNYSRVQSIDIDSIKIDGMVPYSGTKGYKSDFFKIGNELYFEDITFELDHKFSKKFKGVFSISGLSYNKTVMEGEGGMIYAIAEVTDLTYKLTPTKSLRAEIQHLSTEQDLGNIAYGMIEFDIAPNWFFSVADQYNYQKKNNENGEQADRIHYFSGSMGYTKGTTRITLTYGRVRQGLLCVGGVCRQVPASSGLTIGISSSF